MFTFVIPTWGRDTLDYSVKSVLDQTKTDWKCIIQGDGMLPKSYSDNRIISYEGIHNADATKTRTAALEHVNTPWVVFLDDDDWVLPQYLEMFVPHTETSDVIISQMENYGNIIPEDHTIQHGHVGISFAVRTEVLNKEPMPPPPSEDFVYLKHLEINGYRIGFTDKCGYFVRKFLWYDGWRNEITDLLNNA